MPSLSPRENTLFIGHSEPQAQWLEAFNSKRFHHAWLITGPKGIGKATLAFRLARYLLSTKKEATASGGFDLFGASTPAKPSLDLAATDPIINRVASGAHGDLLVLDTSPTDDDENKSEIVVDDVRKVHQFFSMTPSESDWRVVIVDSADQLNHNAANALLKLLEEPPAQSILILISHTPGRLLPTIRSRCINLRLHPLPEPEVSQILKIHHPSGGDDIIFAAAVSSGSPGLALTLAESGALSLYEALIQTLSTLPSLDKLAVLKFAESISGKDDSDWKLAGYLLRYWISTIIQSLTTQDTPHHWVAGEGELRAKLLSVTTLESMLECWDAVGRMMSDAERIHIGKKHTAVTLLESFRNVA